MMKRIGTILGSLLSLMLLSCTADNEYSSAACYLVIENNLHNDATLASAMNASSPGIFVTITKTTSSGATYFHFSSNQGGSSSSIFNAIDAKRILIIGMNGGLIVGFGNLSQPVTFYAYDRECPNCFDPNNIPMKSYPITVNSSGIGTCSKCGRKYDLNNGGIISSGDGGKKMTRYRCGTTGAYGVLSVN